MVAAASCLQRGGKKPAVQPKGAVLRLLHIRCVKEARSRLSVPEWTHDPRDHFQQAKQMTARLFISPRPLGPLLLATVLCGAEREGQRKPAQELGLRGAPKMSEVTHSFIPLPSQKSTVLGSSVPNGLRRVLEAPHFSPSCPTGSIPTAPEQPTLASLSCTYTARYDAY